MLVKAEMVPLPVSAHDKFNEAIYFFNRMLETQTNVLLFPHHLNAFLSALRSVTFYLQAQFRKDPGFGEWYARKQEEMRGDPLLRMLKELRDEALHAKPLALRLLHGPTLPPAGVETDHFEWSFTTDSAGEIRIRMKIGREGPEEHVLPQVRWVLDLPDEIDVLVACDSGLRRIQDLLYQWETRSGPAA